MGDEPHQWCRLSNECQATIALTQEANTFNDDGPTMNSRIKGATRRQAQPQSMEKLLCGQRQLISVNFGNGTEDLHFSLRDFVIAKQIFHETLHRWQKYTEANAFMDQVMNMNLLKKSYDS